MILCASSAFCEAPFRDSRRCSWWMNLIFFCPCCRLFFLLLQVSRWLLARISCCCLSILFWRKFICIHFKNRSFTVRRRVSCFCASGPLVDRLQQVMDVSAAPFFNASRRRRRFAKIFQVFSFRSFFSRLEFIVALFLNTTTAFRKEFDSNSGL